MKALFIAIFATCVFALIIIYHDAQRANAELNTELNDNVRIIVCNGKVVQIFE